MEIDDLPLQQVIAMKSFSTLELATMIRAKLNDPQSRVSADELDSLEKSLQSGLADVHSIFNSCRPTTHELPPEILSMIFYEASAISIERLVNQIAEEIGPTRLLPWETDEVPIFMRPWDTTTDIQILLNLAKVCKFWRRVIMHDPNLWTRVNGSAGNALMRVMQLSKVLPVRVHYLRHEDMRILDPIRRHAFSHKFEELYMCSLATHIPMRLDDTILSFPAPKLKRLAIDFWGKRSNHGSWKSKPILFKDISVELEELTLRRTLWLPANNWPNLTHVCIHNSGSPEMGWNLVDLVTWLSRFPKLKEVIVHAVHAMVPNDRSRGPVAVLNDLERLVLGEFGSTVSALYLLGHIVIPQSCALRVETGGYASWRGGLAEVFATSGFDRFHTLRIEHDRRRVTVLAANDTTGMRLDMMLPGGAGRPADWASSLVDSIPLQNIRTLCLEDLTFTHLRCFATAATLEELFIAASSRESDERSAYLLLECLTINPHLWPSLRMIGLFLTCGLSTEMQWLLLALVKRRFEAKNPLQELRVWYDDLKEGDTGHPFDPAALTTYVGFVQFGDGNIFPATPVPPACTKVTHRYWPAWTKEGVVLKKYKERLAKEAREDEDEDEDESMNDSSNSSASP
ncbi:hypothetical protein OBBRIDRAFT_887198 [Obba rivulosa]|uniref:F-box domain-containing protein n=1 Tax=Obba rivulosa TaxID=1052685 RepID=A0A8E2AU95_9APHY|nr:hypothetical protein OBBRIDRAFT_887198 [Obba rivulosa]